jgi:uncharacterized protein (DUF1778 family)
MEPEFEKYLDKMLDVQHAFNEKFQKELGEKLDGITDSEERARILKNTREKVQKATPALQQEMKEIEESGKKFVDKLKIEMFDILTDEQWDRMLDLIDNPPDYVKKILRKWKEASEKATEWTPGPNSWQPGDPIPEKYRQERQTRGNFPRPKEQQQNKGAE